MASRGGEITYVMTIVLTVALIWNHALCELRPCNSQDLEALHSFKNLLTNSSDSIASSTRNLSQLAGIGSMRALQIQGILFNGFFPLELCQLSNLSRLAISSAGISGRIPHKIRHLQLLEHLDLTANNFSGTIPSALAHLKSLKNLYLDDNALSGQIPAESC
ncbi:receptor-like protein 33 [Cryptomeria japonica]|uniref:receptor-like protein 33 n=1 Tax=Cryptomeria japonica TaxID=3369 RepID=UPI0027DA80F1|nr:receptor-like protein 33 [Cryptomeria japonica]